MAFSGHWLALNLWHPLQDWELLPWVPATLPSTWHQTCQKIIFPAVFPCIWVSKNSQALASTQPEKFNSTGHIEQSPSDGENARSFKQQEKQGPVLKGLGIWKGQEIGKPAMTYRAIITIERDLKHRKRISHSVQRDQGRQSGRRALPGRNKNVQRCRSPGCGLLEPVAIYYMPWSCHSTDEKTEAQRE